MRAILLLAVLVVMAVSCKQSQMPGGWEDQEKTEKENKEKEKYKENWKTEW